MKFYDISLELYLKNVFLNIAAIHYLYWFFFVLLVIDFYHLYKKKY